MRERYKDRNPSKTDHLPVQNRTFSPHLWCIHRIAYGNWNVNLQDWRVLIIYCPNLTRKLTSITRGLTISPSGSNKRQKTKSIPKAAERDRGCTPKRLSGRLRDRSALDFSFSLVVVQACACLGERQRADLYKTSTRQGAKGQFFYRKYPDLYVIKDQSIWDFSLLSTDS